MSAVDVWLTRPDQADDRELLDKYVALLTCDEAARADAFRFERDRLAFLVTRALVRTVLSRYEEVAPQDWRFVAEARGRPEVAPELGSRLRFSLSRTAGLVACAVTTDDAVGVDVEVADLRVATTELAERFFSPAEAADVQAAPPGERAARFFTYWTLKEAYVKARGEGLAIPLGQFSFRPTDAGTATIAFDPALADDPRTWQFHHEWPTPTHSLAVALRRPGSDLAVTLRETVPLMPSVPGA